MGDPKSQGEHKYERVMTGKIHVPPEVDIIEALEEVTSKSAGRQVSYHDIKSTLVKYLKAKDASEVVKMAKDQKTLDNLPFSAAVHGATGVTPYVPVEMPSILEIADTSYHPKGYLAAKRGVVDVIAQLDNFADQFKGDEYRYFRDEFTSVSGRKVRLKLYDEQNKSHLKKFINRREMQAKLKSISDLYLEHQDAIKTKNHKLAELKGARLFREINDIVDIDLVKKDLEEAFEGIKKSLQSGSKDVDLAVVKFRGNDEFELSFKRNGIRWTVKAPLIKQGNLIKFGKVLNFLASASPEALLKAKQIMKELECTGFKYEPVFKKSQLKVMFFDKKAVSGGGNVFVPSSKYNPHFMSLFVGGLAGAGLEGFLEGITQLSKGADVTDALNKAAWKAVGNFVTGTAMSYLMNKLVQWGIKKVLAVAAKNAITQAGATTAVRLGSKAIPIVGWVYTAWDVGWTTGRAINDFLMLEWKQYCAQCRPEYEAVRNAFYDDPKGSRQQYHDMDKGIKMRGLRWRFTGPPFNVKIPFNYDTVPRSIRLEEDGTIIEYGVEPLFPGDSFLPFCRYLPTWQNLSADADFRNRWDTIKKDYDEIGNRLLTLETSTEWIMEGHAAANANVNTIESCKERIAANEGRLSTEWAYFKSPEKYEIYYWRDCQKKTYAWGGTEGDFNSDPATVSDEIHIFERTKKALGIS